MPNFLDWAFASSSKAAVATAIAVISKSFIVVPPALLLPEAYHDTSRSAAFSRRCARPSKAMTSAEEYCSHAFGGRGEAVASAHASCGRTS